MKSFIFYDSFVTYHPSLPTDGDKHQKKMAEYFEYEFKAHQRNIVNALALCNHKNKTETSNEELIKALRRLILTKPNINFSRTDDEFISRFLHARECNIPDSFELLTNYFAFCQQNQILFEKLNVYEDQLMLQALKDGLPGVLSERDRKGRCVLVMFAANWDHCSYNLMTIFRALVFTLEKLLENIRNQINGFLVIIDWSEFTYRQSTNLTPKLLKLMISFLQDCFPATFKGVHFVNQPWYVEAAFTFIRPFLKEKMKNKIYMHGNNLSTLHDRVAKDILPTEMGGEGPSYNPLTWVEQVMCSSKNVSSFSFEQSPVKEVINNMLGD